MSLHSPEHNVNPRSWIKALLLSPGMLFLFAIPAIYSVAGQDERHVQGAGPAAVSGLQRKHLTLTIGSIEPGVRHERHNAQPGRNGPRQNSVRKTCGGT